MKFFKRNWNEMITNIVKWAVFIYLIIFVPYLFLGIKIGATVTFGIIFLWIIYEANEKHHKKREDHLKDLLRNEGLKENTINHGLEKIDEELSNR